MKKIFRNLLTLVMFVIIGIGVGIPMTNNVIAKRVANELADIPVPANTELIESTSLAGKLIGNENGVQHFGAILVKSDIGLKRLQEYYSKYSSEATQYIVVKQESNEIDLIEHNSLHFEREINDKRYYMVYTVKSSDGIILNMDLRGY